jgi:hypothetical protein
MSRNELARILRAGKSTNPTKHYAIGKILLEMHDCLERGELSEQRWREFTRRVLPLLLKEATA